MGQDGTLLYSIVNKFPHIRRNEIKFTTGLANLFTNMCTKLSVYIAQASYKLGNVSHTAECVGQDGAPLNQC